jgi:uncharacterized protein
MIGVPPQILIVSLIMMGVSALVSFVLKTKFTKYTKVPLQSGLTGKEVAEKMLRDNGLLKVF